jgi:SRSO17 transposase
LPALVKIAGIRWTTEENFQAGKGRAGLDEHQVRRWGSWYRWTTLAMLALAFLTVTRASLADDDAGLASSANEIRRMFTALCAQPRDQQHARRWSRWRHLHQERARRCHYQRQRLQDH